MSNWQPIETAPKDGTLIIGLGLPLDPETFQLPDTRVIKIWFVGDVWGWARRNRFGDFTVGFSPTHWMPLPEAPTP